MRKISDSTVRRLSVYLRFLEQANTQGRSTISSGELARLGGTTSAQVRKDLSFFGSFGKRGLGYAVPELTRRIRDILGLERGYRVVLVWAGPSCNITAFASGAFTSPRSTIRMRAKSGRAGTAWWCATSSTSSPISKK